MEAIDLSSHNHPSDDPIDWRQVKDSGVELVIVKLTEGGDYINPYAVGDCIGARNAGMAVAVYHFARPESHDPNTEAAWFLAHLPSAGPVVFRALDVETGQEMGWPALADKVSALLDAGGFDVIYLNRSYLDGLGEHGAPWGHKVWLADPDEDNPDRPHDIHQYGQGEVPGIVGAVDLDRFAFELPEAVQTGPADPDPVPGAPAGAEGPLTVDSHPSAALTLPQVAHGGTGPAVQAVQALVTLRGYAIAVDGDFGPMTESAVRAFQAQAGAAVDGIVGPETWWALVTIA